MQLEEHALYNNKDQFQKEIRKVWRRGLRSPKYAELGHFTIFEFRNFRNDLFSTTTD